MHRFRRLLLCAAALLAPALAHAGERPRLEVAFVLDATGSMGAWIDAARARIQGIAGELAQGEPAPEVRFALVSFRDQGDAYVTRKTDFSPDLAQMKAALDGTRAEGGGDYPEAVLEALSAGVFDLSWSERDADVVKLLYLVGDAPPQHYPTSPDETKILRAALERGIVVHSIVCGTGNRETQAFFDRVARRSEGRVFSLAAPGRPAPASRGAAEGPSLDDVAPADLASAVGGSARAYSESAGVAYTEKAAPPVTASALTAPRVEPSGLLGAQLRHVTDAAAFSDLWAAHTSLLPGTAPRPSPPTVDFAHSQVLVLGGADAGLELQSLTHRGAARLAQVGSAEPGVRFVVIPAEDSAVLVTSVTPGADQ